MVEVRQKTNCALWVPNYIFPVWIGLCHMPPQNFVPLVIIFQFHWDMGNGGIIGSLGHQGRKTRELDKVPNQVFIRYFIMLRNIHGPLSSYWGLYVVLPPTTVSNILMSFMSTGGVSNIFFSKIT